MHRPEPVKERQAYRTSVICRVRRRSHTGGCEGGRLVASDSRYRGLMAIAVHVPRDHCLAPERVDAPIGEGGRYGRMFDLPALEADEKLLLKLGAVGSFCDGGDHADDARVEAGWPFFGQYVAHDLTADRSTSARAHRPGGAPQHALAPCEPRVALRRRASRHAVPVQPRRPGEAARARRRPSAKPGRHCADRRPAQRRPRVHEPDAGRVHPRSQSPRRALARGRRRRWRALRRGAARAHVALPVADRQRLPPRSRRARARRRAPRRRRPVLPPRRRAVHPARVRGRRLPLRPLTDPSALQAPGGRPELCRLSRSARLRPGRRRQVDWSLLFDVPGRPPLNARSRSTVNCRGR